MHLLLHASNASETDHGSHSHTNARGFAGGELMQSVRIFQATKILFWGNKLQLQEAKVSRLIAAGSPSHITLSDHSDHETQVGNVVCNSLSHMTQANQPWMS